MVRHKGLNGSVSVASPGREDGGMTAKPASFEAISIADLERLDAAGLDALPFGVVGMAATGDVVRYNAAESKFAGLATASVMGHHFFNSVAPCMNNFLVAQRFEDEPELDAVVDYVLTFRMRPKPVTLRLLQAPSAEHSYVLIQPKVAA